MNVFFIFAPAFVRWPLAIAREFARQDPSFRGCGIATGPRAVFDEVAACMAPKITPLSRIDDLARQWLATPVDNRRLSEFERRLGTAAIRRIMIADRQVGVGYIQGAKTPRTSLTERVTVDNIDAPRRYLCGLLSYVFGVLEKERPDAVFCYGVAGSTALALAEVSRVLGVRFIRLTAARIGTRYLLDSDARGLMAPVRDLFLAAQRDSSCVEKFLPAAREWLKGFRQAPSSPEYAVTVRNQYLHSLSAKAFALQLGGGIAAGLKVLMMRARRDLRRPVPWQHARLMKAFATLRARRLIRSTLFSDFAAVGSYPYAFFPLHVDPEATTMVLSPMHTNQLGVIEALAKSLPIGMNLVVKEHVPMLGWRPRGYYERIAAIPGVILFSPFADTMTLIRNAALTCVITGTAAWEAMLLGRPALIVGNSPYMTVGEGFEYCPDLSRLTEAIERALKLSPVGEQRLELFLAAIFAKSFDLPNDVLWGKITEDTVRENEDVLHSICGRLREMALAPVSHPN
jgi:hypothetical protein